ncbi:hypothetical protein BDY19DRAFT_975348 [Irpex rosettiformis]|uniref:Uncharacterized protein n=1 Tax=Irpex rosettiformis TaxID=378272 RepID=A0ACB8TPA7_9APHY|nr:hypothetical protein BDY19DRAFT_975348 [Irpex rosettiformis]
MDFIHRKLSSRKYVDPLKDSCSKWANWDPPKIMHVGDSGEFIHEGNVYTHPDLVPIAHDHPVQPTAEDDLLLIKSAYARRIEQAVGVQGTAVLATAAVSIQVQFTKRRGAFLVKHKARMSHLPDDLLNRLRANSILKDKCLVSEVFFCRGYAQYLSNRNNYIVMLALDNKAGGAPTSGGVNLVWNAQGAQGYLRHSYNEKPVFSPLYGLKVFRSSCPVRREDFELTAANGEWMDVGVPWDDLNENGVEDVDTDVRRKRMPANWLKIEE